jgi:hypothetical protein
LCVVYLLGAELRRLDCLVGELATPQLAELRILLLSIRRQY